MSRSQANAAVDGQELAIPDWNAAGTIAGLADDAVISEILRLTPYDGTSTYKTIIPYGSLPIENSLGSTATNPGTVQSTGSANGAVNVFPFRGVIGSRTAVGTNPALNWTDIRSAVFVGGTTTLPQTIQLAANSSGNPRWDLIYAIVGPIDNPSGSATRRIKDPTTGVVTAVSVTTQLVNAISVTSLAGTPSSSPAIPALPADSGGVYHIAIAAVRVPNGFSSTSTIANQDIRDVVGDWRLTAGAGQTVAPPSEAMFPTVLPASGNNDRVGFYTTHFNWTGSSGQRPPPFLPPGMAGGRQIIAEIINTSTPSHPNQGIVDDTIDWRNRMFWTICQFASSSNTFANDPLGSAGSVIPFWTPLASIVSSELVNIQVSNSFKTDAQLQSGGSTVFLLNSATSPDGFNVGLYVDQSTGILRWSTAGTGTSIYWFWVMATGAFPNA